MAQPAKKIESSYSKPLPNAVEAEIAVLGSCLQDSRAVDISVDILKPTDFYKGAHRTIFEHITKLYFKRDAVDILTVAESLGGSEALEGIGGNEYIAQLAVLTPSAANVESHCQLVKEKSRIRQAFEIGQEIQRAVLENQSADDIAELIGKRTTDLVAGQRGGFKPIAEYLHEFTKDIEKRARGEYSGIKTHIQPIDNE
jgi:replicative DNA helicase